MQDDIDNDWPDGNIYGFELKRKPVVNDNVWHRLDLELVCKEGGELYTPKQYHDFFCKIFGLQISDREPVKPEVSLWRVNRKYVVYFRWRDHVYHMNLWKKTMHRGESSATCRSFPIVWDEDQMEFDLMCLFLLEILEQRKDPRGRRWSK